MRLCTKVAVGWPGSCPPLSFIPYLRLTCTPRRAQGGIQGIALPQFSSSKGYLWCPLVQLCSSHCYNIWTPRCPLKGMGIGFNQIKSDDCNTHHEKPHAGCLSHHPNLIGFRLTQNKLKEKRRQSHQTKMGDQIRFKVIFFSGVQTPSRESLHHPIVSPHPCPCLSVSISPIFSQRQKIHMSNNEAIHIRRKQWFNLLTDKGLSECGSRTPLASTRPSFFERAVTALGSHRYPTHSLATELGKWPIMANPSSLWSGSRHREEGGGRLTQAESFWVLPWDVIYRLQVSFTWGF